MTRIRSQERVSRMNCAKRQTPLFDFTARVKIFFQQQEGVGCINQQHTKNPLKNHYFHKSYLRLYFSTPKKNENFLNRVKM
jgi:hypothetical protein